MSELPGYTQMEFLEETLNAFVFRAVKTSSNERVVIKFFKIEDPSALDVARFKHEHDLIRKVDSDGIVKVLDIIAADGRLILVGEDFEGISLTRYAENPLGLDKVLDIAIRVGRILGDLHTHNVIHRDLKPDNIRYNSRTDTLKITDFGIIAELTGVYEEVYNPPVIQGTLPYLSPEQTGRMNCGVDYRTDYYSLGITLYELLTGQVPFTGRDPMEIIHAHIARRPEPPHVADSRIPVVVSDIVMRLLAKTAQERYQNSEGLISDLTECRDRLMRSGRIAPFDIGRCDVSPKFNLPHMLVGREEELDALFKAFDRVSSGETKFLFVSGAPGIGKSALVHEIHKPIVQRRGFFITGKYDQLRQSVPYSAIIQAGQLLAGLLLAEREDRIEDWRKRILAALGPNGRIVTDIIPDVQLIIGRQPEVPELSPEEARNRFKLVLKNFLRVFADRRHPLVLFLDDLQWADPASLALMQDLALDQDLRHFFLIGAYRDNEVAAHHPLMRATDAMRRHGMDVARLVLEPLGKQSINRMLADILHCEKDVSEPLAAVIVEKTFGNPFFVHQFLRRLYENRSLFVAPANGWQWHLSSIKNMQVTENVVEFMAEKIRDLPPDPLAFIKIGACIGNRFDVETLSAVAGRSIEDVLYAMDVLLQEGLLAYTNGRHRFAHDRIHEAAYFLLAPEDRERLHYRIGRLELDRTSPEALYHQIFYIVDQLNKARHLLADSEERRRLADLDLKAGTKAKESSAYQAAVTYLQAGLDLLPEDAWAADYRLMYALHMEQMACQYLARNFDEAEKLFDTIIGHASGKTDLAKAYNVMIVLYTNMHAPEKAIRLGLDALRLFGMRLSAGVGPLPVLLEMIKVRWKLRKINPNDIVDLPFDEDKTRTAYHALMLNIATPAYLVNPNLFAYLVLRGSNEMLAYGIQSHAAATFISLSTIFESARGDYELGYRIGKMALELNQRCNDRKVAGQVRHIFAFFIQHWKKHARHDVEIYAEVYQLCLNAGNFIFAGHGVNAATDCRLMIGDRLDDILQETEKYREFMRQVKDPFIAARYTENIQMIKNLKGLTPERCSLSGEEFDEVGHLENLYKENNIYGVCFALLYRAKLLYLYGEYEDARIAAETLKKHIKVLFGTLLVSEHCFYHCMILTALLGAARPFRQYRYKAAIRKHLKKMARWAALCPENFRHKHDLIQAELMAATGRIQQALSLYHAAARGARQNDFIHEEALAFERLALFYDRLRVRQEARMFMQLAFQRYGQWGSAAKQRDLERRYPDLLPVNPGCIPSEAPSARGSSEFGSRLLDMSTVMQVCQAISGEIVLERLLQKIMHLSLANAGAQRGFLILPRQGRLSIEAGQDLTRQGHGLELPRPLEESRDLSPSVVNYVWRSREPVILADAVRHGPFISDAHVVRNQCKSILCMPILNKGRLSAILYMENNLTADAFTAERLEILGIIAAQAAISLENAGLFDLATTDGLTKLFVHRYFQLLLENEIERSRRYDRPLALVMMDIDNFKHFNDTYGHPMGDEVLKSVGRLLREKIRTVDIAARYGGEEFVLVLPETDIQQALITCEKIRRNVEQMRIPQGHAQLQVTVSLGVAAFPQHALEKKSLISSADEALYVSKRAGKNRVSVGRKVLLQIEPATSGPCDDRNGIETTGGHLARDRAKPCETAALRRH